MRARSLGARFGAAVLIPLLATAATAHAQSPDERPTWANGTWRAWLETPGGGELPFGLTLGAADSTIDNGVEHIPIPLVEVTDERVVLSMPHYDSKIEATRSGDDRSRLQGTWRKRRGAESFTVMTFHATKGDAPRFTPNPNAAPAATGRTIDGRWRVAFEKDAHPAVGVFETRDDGTVQGTFLTALGDYRYLAGEDVGGVLRLSCFDGAHAFLFHARRTVTDGLTGDFWSRDTWHETWTATRDDDAALPDPYRMTRWTGAPDALAGLAFPDLEGESRRLDDPAFRGAARILVVFGSWCPNCKDATKLLATLEKRYRDRGLRVLGLAFELTGDAARDRAQVRRYVEHQGVEFPVLVAGVADKAKASEALPLLDRVRAYPTTVFLHGDGRVHTVHTGFSGPATGAEHETLVARFDAIVRELLGADGARPKRGEKN